MAVLGLTACSPDSFDGANGQIPSLDGVEPVVTVDQNLNQVTFSLPDNVKGCMPVWIFYENKGTDKEKVTYSTVNGLKRIFAKAGDYDAEFKLMNRNGVSDGSKSFKFRINNTIMDFGKYYTLLCGGKENSSKEWRIDNSQVGHLGCGPTGTTGKEWWSAGSDEKAAFGVYDNRMTFSADNKYTFNPGESGTIYVNKGVKALGGPAAEDFTVPAAEQETTFEFDVQGEDLYIVLPAHTNFPYIAGDEVWESPRFKVESMTGSEINLITDIKTDDNPDGIAWHYILTSGAAPQKFTGFDVNSPDNLWKQANPVFQSLFYAHGGNWEGYPDYEHSEGDNIYTITLPSPTDMQWQAQYCLGTDLNKDILIPGTKYDFSLKIVSNADLPSFTAKLTSPTDDPSLINNQGSPAQINAYEETIIYFTEQVAPDFDGNYKFVFDFGGNPENTEITIKDIVIIDHSKNTIVPPSDDPGDEPGDVVWVDPNSADNLLNGGGLTLASTFWAAGDDWHGCAAPDVNINGRKVNILVNEANGTLQWQGQVHLNTGVAIEEGKAYDFKIVLNPSQNITGATVKPHPEGDDGHFFSEGRHDLEGYSSNEVTYENFVADFSTGNLVITLDFPGCETGATIDVEEIIIQEHRGSGKVDWPDVDSEENLYSKANFVLNSTYWAAGDDWHGCAAPNVDVNGRKAVITVVEANGTLQWQGQAHFGSGVSMKEGETYNFSITINPSQNISGVTVKPHPAGDDGHFISEGRHDIEAYADNVITYTGFVSDFTTDDLVITLDFPGCDAGTVIEVKDIILCK